jgi:hypothetical protein
MQTQLGANGGRRWTGIAVVETPLRYRLGKECILSCGAVPQTNRELLHFEETPLLVPSASILTPTFSRLCESLIGMATVLQNHGLLQYFIGGSIIAFEYGEIDLIYAIR